MGLVRSLQKIICALLVISINYEHANAQAPETSSPIAVTKYERRCTPDISQLDFKIDHSLSEKFGVLKKIRQSISQYSQQSNSDLDFFKQRLDQFERLVIPVAPVMDGPSSEEIRGRISRNRAQIDRVVGEIETANLERDGVRADSLRKDRLELERELSFLETMLPRTEAREKEIYHITEESKRSAAKKNSEIDQINASIRAARADVDCLVRAQSHVDEAINTLLIPETQKNDFKLKISYIFAGMVILVIVGFFVVALRDKSVASAIFSNQTGIQFVTLFSLVIAIILFGITDILQAKELSALLGGISGYILGRVTSERMTGNTVAQTQTQIHPKTTVSANTISVTAPSMILATGEIFRDFIPGGRIRVSGAAKGSNNDTFTVASVTPNQIVVRETTLATEEAGSIITIMTT